MRALLATLLLVVLIAPAAAQTSNAQTTPRAPSAEEKNRFVRERLVDAILLMDRHFRVPETGQYLDAITVGSRGQGGDASTAATGIGLVSLALGDALGVIPDAEAKAEHTLRNLLSLDRRSGFRLHRSRSGWYPHYMHAVTGKASKSSAGKVSTIDTALLAAGAAIAARYFNAKSYTSGRGEAEVFRLAGRVVGGVRWRSAIKDVERGLVHLVFFGEEEAEWPGIYANPFDEYAIIPCIAMRGEQMGGVRGPAHETFERHYARDRPLPTRLYKGVPVVAKPSGAFVPHFTHLFAFYYCNAFNTQPRFRRQLRDLALADRRHFADEQTPHLWGLGAGTEVTFAPDGTVGARYAANALSDNPHRTASPAIMAGFAPLFAAEAPDDPLNDLMRLWRERTCRYEHAGLGFLWRCSARDPRLKVRTVQAVDFSTWILGLAGRDPAFGLPFFVNFNL